MTEKFTDSPYNTIEEWENNDVEGYTKAYDDMIAEYPSYLRGLTKTEKQQETCCDLLENSYICSIANNIFSCNNLIIEVVICLKTRTFAVSQTTKIKNLFKVKIANNPFQFEPFVMPL